MNEKTDTEIISRRRAIWMLGVAAAFGMAMPAAVLTASEADAQTPGVERRQGRRPNLVLHYADRTGATLGRSLARGQRSAIPCTRALVVLKWDERRDRFYVLTAYPEADR